VALLLETGLLLVLIPWSNFWERNYFVEWSPAIEGLLTSNYVRGAISGLGLVNLAAALVELADVLGNRAAAPARDDLE
jgi:ABC-type transport system involved in cytochrome c biogenesis permease subunit